MMNSKGKIANTSVSSALAHKFHQLTEQINTKAVVNHNDELLDILANNEQLLISKLISHLEVAGSHYCDELNELVQIDASFSNLQTGNYGLCSDCECEIARELLDETPFRQRCRQCLTKHNAAPVEISL